ncbi:MAG: signal peptidase I [Eubacteriales bacterium]|nr:signal peptidase I [Eubacteriales bacterium]
MFRKIWNVVYSVIVAVVVLLAVAFVGVRVVGLQPFTVLSGSMEPTYHTGSLIYVKSVEPQDVHVGDPITFVLNEDLVVATHRVIEIDAENERFYTKGDANESADGSPVHFNNLIGVPVFTIPLLGYVANFVTNPPGMYIALAGVAVLLLLTFVPDLIKKVDSGGDTNAKGKKNKEGVATEPAANAADEETNDDISPQG